MGLSHSLLSWAWIEFVKNRLFGLTEDEAALIKSSSFGEKDSKMTLRSPKQEKANSDSKMISCGSNCAVMGRSLSFKNWEPEAEKLEDTVPFNNQAMDDKKPEALSVKRPANAAVLSLNPAACFPEIFSPRPLGKRDEAATKLQKYYKSYRTRRNVADCVVVAEELWWKRLQESISPRPLSELDNAELWRKALDFASLNTSSISFFATEKPQTAVSRWSRALNRVAKVGKGLSKDEKAQKLALRHWLEAIDPRHRYGHNLHLYFDIWLESESTQPFFYWLDVGDGLELNLEKCSRSKLQQQRIEYLGPEEREAYEVKVENGKLVYKQSELLVNTTEGSKWIFVLSTLRTLYVGQKKKGRFQHSSFLAGAATSAAGRLVAKEGILMAIWPYSGHYLPTEEHFQELISFLQDNNVDLTNVKRGSVDDDDFPSFKKDEDEPALEEAKESKEAEALVEVTEVSEPPKESDKLEHVINSSMDKAAAFKLRGRLSCKWTTAAGARIGCMRDYPADLQSRALEQVNLSPRVIPSPRNKVPIPSPRPSPKIRLSPRLQYMHMPRPTVSLTLPQSKRV